VYLILPPTHWQPLDIKHFKIYFYYVMLTKKIMENILLLPETETLTGKKIRSKMTGSFFQREQESVNSFVDFLISEGGETFYNYLNGMGHAYKPNMMLLSSRHNYYYDLSDLRGASSVINLKKLNRVPHLKSFLNTVSGAIVPGTWFAGCFSESRTSGNAFKSNLSQVINREEIAGYLESIGLVIYDMTEIKGLTFFLAKKN
jgi:hypothetical protein